MALYSNGNGCGQPTLLVWPHLEIRERPYERGGTALCLACYDRESNKYTPGYRAATPLQLLPKVASCGDEVDL